MRGTICSSVSVVNILLQWYLHVFCMFQSVLGLSSLQFGGPLTTADRKTQASEGVYGIDSYGIRHSFLP